MMSQGDLKRFERLVSDFFSEEEVSYFEKLCAEMSDEDYLEMADAFLEGLLKVEEARNHIVS